MKVQWVHPPAWLPKGGDARDFFEDERGSVELLRSLIRDDEPPWPVQAQETKPKLILPPGLTAAELQKKVFTPPRWAVPGLLTEGATILAGRPKLGKSWLNVHLGVEVARGGLVLDALGWRVCGHCGGVGRTPPGGA